MENTVCLFVCLFSHPFRFTSCTPLYMDAATRCSLIFPFYLLFLSFFFLAKQQEERYINQNTGFFLTPLRCHFHATLIKDLIKLKSAICHTDESPWQMRMLNAHDRLFKKKKKKKKTVKRCET